MRFNTSMDRDIPLVKLTGDCPYQVLSAKRDKPHFEEETRTLRNALRDLYSVVRLLHIPHTNDILEANFAKPCQVTESLSPPHTQITGRNKCIANENSLGAQRAGKRCVTRPPLIYGEESSDNSDVVVGGEGSLCRKGQPSDQRSTKMVRFPFKTLYFSSSIFRA